MIRTKFAFAIALFSPVGGAQAHSSAPILGWWHATLNYAGDTSDTWLHIVGRDGKLAVSFSNPEIGIYEQPIGGVIVKPKSIELTDVGWSLRREPSGWLTGIVPKALVPIHRVRASFRPSGAPPRSSQPRPAETVPQPVWQQDVGSAVYAGLTYDSVRQQVIVVTDSGKIIALRSSNGTEAWSADGGAPIRATPLVLGSDIYIPTDNALLKLDSATGKRIWSAAIGVGKTPRLEISDPKSRWDHYSSSAVGAGNAIYVGSRDGCIYRFSAASGARLGRYCATDMVTATPVVDGSRLYFASFDRNVYAADIVSGRLLWKRDMHGAVPRDLALVGHNILVGSRSYDLTALDTKTGRPAWARYYWYSWVDSVPNPMGRTIYIGSSDSLHVFAFDGFTGTKRWQSRVPGWTWARPAVGRTTVYASVTGTTTPYAGPRAGGLAAIGRANGKLRWLFLSEKPEKKMIYGFASAPVVANNMVYAADLSGHIFAFKDR